MEADNTEAPTRDQTDVVGARVGAQLIDLLLMFVAFFITFSMFAAVGGAASAGGSEGVASAFTGLGFLVAAVVSLGYSFFLEAFWNGQTIGKKIFGIKVVREDGSVLDAGAAFIRNIPAIVSMGWIAYLVALLSMAASDRRQRLFDRLAGTVVIRE